MKRIFAPTLGPCDWCRLLANPSRQWVRGRSAFETAVSWESARTTVRGIPPAVCDVLDTRDELRGSVLLLGIPEHQIELSDGLRASQADLWALLRCEGGLASLAVEGKAGEPFDRTVSEWSAHASPRSNKPDRLKRLQARLGIEGSDVSPIRYQLIHRAVSALLQAEQFCASIAVLVVQSFGGHRDENGLEDFRDFGRLFSVGLERGQLHEVPVPGNIRLFLGWATCPLAEEHELESAGQSAIAANSRLGRV